MLTAARFVEVLALGLWLGGMVFFAFVVAPAAFAVLPTRQQAGDLVAWVLPRLHFLGFVCGLVYLVGLFLEQRLTSGGRAWVVPAALVVVALLLALINHYGLGGQMAELRAQMTAAFGGVDQTPRDHALRLRFGRLHGYSSLLLSANLLLVLSLLVLTVRRFR